jgi:PKD repeat protein
VHGRLSGLTERVSVANDGSEALGESATPVALSADGRHVAFLSYAVNLVPGGPPPEYWWQCAYVRDRVSETGFYASLNARGKVPLLVRFMDLSACTPSGPATAWAWDFGDGGTSTEQNPTHEYTTVGVYTVSLTATNPGGPLTTVKEDYTTVSFKDIAICPPDYADYWALRHVGACVAAGIVGGYPGGVYLPTVPVTRDQMAVFISRALAGGDSLVPTGPPTATFSDVPTGYWAFKYVEYTVDHGVVGGYSDGTYRPTTTVTRDQMAVFIARAMVGGDSLVPSGPATATFPDVPTDFWAFKYVEYIRGEGVTGGYPDGLYHPEYACTRDQMAVFVQRAFELPM